jgi:hypothetical protein
MAFADDHLLIDEAVGAIRTPETLRSERYADTEDKKAH